MSEVKRYECLLIEDAPRLQAILPQGAVVCSERTQMMVTAEDYATLEAEAQALREELKNRTAECNGLHEMLRQEHDRTEKAREEVAALRRFAGEIYQVLGALDAPENVLDNASDAANGDKLRHKTLLPFAALRARVVVPDEREAYIEWMAATLPELFDHADAAAKWRNQHVSALAWQARARLNGKAVSEALRKDAERYRWLRSLPRGNRHGDMTIMLAKDRPSPNQWCGDTIRGEALDAAIDAALEGGGR